ncbi:hypothetical protein HPB47_021459 [Ixodes persulcatus]|uniref:Uncharacterized protein n=1 Tax=Ixodes persulcatus TaxID=34615 RepID=A0AC60QES5_IXOPE|nr:hypothetical protein HPB47_021459 [Ixodes persulcatus]
MPKEVKVKFLHNTNYNIQDKSGIVPEPNLFAARSLSAMELRENGFDHPVDSFRTTSAVSHTPPGVTHYVLRLHDDRTEKRATRGSLPGRRDPGVAPAVSVRRAVHQGGEGTVWPRLRRLGNKGPLRRATWARREALPQRRPSCGGTTCAPTSPRAHAFRGNVGRTRSVRCGGGG